MGPGCAFSGVGLLPASGPSVWGTGMPSTRGGGEGSRNRNLGNSAGNSICRPEDDRGCSFSLPPVVSTASWRPNLPHHTDAHGAWLLRGLIQLVR